MAVKKRPKLAETIEGVRYGKLLLREEDRQVEWTDEETQDTFLIRAIWPINQRNIGARMSAIMNSMAQKFPGASIHTLPSADVTRMERDATIEEAVVEGPDGWAGVEGCPDDTLLDRLSTAILEHTNKLLTELKKNRSTERGNGSGVVG